MDEATRYYLYIAIGSFAILLNLIEIILICKIRKSLKSYERLLLSLSAGDLISGLSFLCLGIFHFASFQLPAHSFLIRAVEMMAFAFSAANLLVIGLDRLVAVRFPIKHQIWVTPNKMKFTIIGLWTILLLSEVLQLWGFEAIPGMFIEKNFIHLKSWPIISSAIVFSVIYTYIIYVVIHSRDPTITRSKERRHQDNLVITTCVSIVVIYLVCTCPVAIEGLISKESSHVTSVFLVVNSMLDPLVYFFKNYSGKKIKKEIRGQSTAAIKTVDQT